MIEAALLANPWYAAALVAAVYVFGYIVALYEARLYLDGVDETIIYRGGYTLAREYANAWGRRRPASWRFLALLEVLIIAIPLAGQVALQRFSQPELFLAIVGGLVLVDLAESLEHLRNIALFRAVLDGDSVGGKIELARRATLTVRYVEWYSLTAIYALIAVVAGSWFCAGGALGCVVAAQRLRDWVIVRT
jgi:hypothetical protein